MQWQPLAEYPLGRLKRIYAWLVIGCLAVAFLWIFYGEVAIWISHSYTIGEVVRKRRGNRFELVIDFTYTVNGVHYQRSASWDYKAKVGDRYLVRYAVLAPYGNHLYYDYPVPDSVELDHGVKWQRFMQAIKFY